MKEIKEMQKIAEEIIQGHDKNVNKLKEIIIDFFKGKDQKFFDKFEQKQLQMIIQISESLDPINEITKAYLDYIFHKDKPIKYFWRLIKGKASPERLRELKDFLSKNINFNEKEEGLVKWIEWLIKEDVGWDDASFEDIEKDFRIDINITQYYEIPDVEIFVIGLKKYEKLVKKMSELFND